MLHTYLMQILLHILYAESASLHTYRILILLHTLHATTTLLHTYLTLILWHILHADSNLLHTYLILILLRMLYAESTSLHTYFILILLHILYAETTLLHSYCRDEDEGKNLNPKLTFNPYLQRLYQVGRWLCACLQTGHGNENLYAYSHMLSFLSLQNVCCNFVYKCTSQLQHIILVKAGKTFLGSFVATDSFRVIVLQTV